MKKLTHVSQFIALLILLNIIPAWLTGQQIYINEFLASNSNVNVDEFGESDDWIELYNPNGSSVNISGMFLTDDLTNLTKWALPSGTSIPAFSFLLIWCDNQPAQGPLHAPFKLSSGGEEVAITATDGVTILDSYTYGIQTANVSLGRESDGQTPWVFFTAPTPGETNGGAGNTIASMPVADIVGGHYSSDFFVSLSTVTSGATIRYTTDGSEPTSTSSTYNSAIEIDETTTLRARAFKSGMEPSRTMTHTYLYNIDHTLPIFCLSTDDDNFFGEEDGIYENWSEDIEQPVHVELFEADGSFAFRQDLGVQVHGGFSQSYPHKGISFIARNEYGNNKINYPLFPDLPFNQYGSFILRASGNDWSKLLYRDALASSLVREFDDVDSLIKDPDLELQAYRPAIVYLNGEYFGIHNLREKLDWRYLETHYDLDKDDVDIIQKRDNVEKGNVDAWDEYFEFVEDADFTDANDLAALQTWIDLDHFIDYFLLNIYVDNNDWPDNNNKRWRLRQDSQQWHYFVYDMDRGFGLIPIDGNYNSGDWTSESLEMVMAETETADHNSPWSTLLLRKLMENEEVRIKFINRMADQLNIMYNTDRVIGRIDEFEDVYDPEIDQHADLWWNNNVWHNNVDKARLFAEHRDEEMWDQYDEFFDDITDVVDLTMNAQPAAGGNIHLNTINLREANYPWEGTYFEGVDVPLYTVPNPGYIFTGWTPSSLGNDPITVMNLDGDTEITANFMLGSTQIGNIVINEINYHSPDTCDSSDWLELFNAGTESVDISGWFLEDGSGNYFSLPSNTILSGQGYLVLVEDAVRFQNVHPSITNFIAGFGNSLTGEMGLSNGGEWISINNADRSFMDTVHYDDKLPWPEEPDGDGPTLQLISHTLDNALYSSWVASGEAKGTPGEPNQGVLYLGPNTVLCSSSDITLDASYEPCFACTYSWNTGASTSNITVTPSSGSNVYAVTVTDAGGATQTDEITIDLSLTFTLSYSNTNLLCSDDGNGTIDLQVSGSGSYTYAWTNGANTQDISNLTVGDYIVTVTDGLFCSQTQEVSITAPPALVANSNETEIDCFGDLASIDVSVSGGAGPYSYLWSNGATTDDLSNLPEGDYNLTITDNNNCSKVLEYSFNEPTELVGDFDIEHGCNGLNNGNIDVDMEGGSGGYYYEWNNGEASSSDDLFDLGAGIYVVTVSDNSGCTWVGSAEVYASTNMTASTSITNLLCPDDSNGGINLTISGGTSPYQYEWSNGETTTQIQNLAEGPYLVTVTDLSGCQYYDSLYVGAPTPVAATATINAVSCFGGSDGTINVIGSGGSGGYSYLWSTGAVSSSIGNLVNGNYGLTVTDNNNCSNTFSFAVDQPQPLVANPTPVNINCNGSSTGGVLLNLTGGTAPFSYLWSNGTSESDLSNVPAGAYTVTITDDNNCSTSQSAIVTENTAIATTISQSNLNCNNTPTGTINLNVSGGQGPYTYLWNTGQTAANLSILSAGTYLVTISDINACTQTQSITLTEPSAISAEVTETNVLCYGDNNGSISIQANGGNAPYTYLWNTGALADTINSLTADIYIVTITDNNNCTLVQNATVEQPDALASTLSPTNISCFGMTNGQISINNEGGTGPYTYLWNTGSVDGELNSLSANTYSITISDTNGCTQTESVSITEPDPISNTYQSTSIACNNQETGSINITTTGGYSPYSYLWNTNQASNEILNLGADSYTVTITDDQNCTAIQSIELTEPSTISSDFTITHNLCYGDEDGTVQLTASGGTAPYDYEWNNGADDSEIDDLAAGQYIVTITDDNNCTHTAETIITEPDQIEANPITVDLECFGFTTGTIDITPTGGTGTYTYDWSTGSSGQDINNIGEGNYTLTITDSNNCNQTETVSIIEPDMIATEADVIDVSCNGENNGEIMLLVSGGVSPYEYNWSNGVDVSNPVNLVAGEYLVTITDDNGCTQEQTIEVAEPNVLTYNNFVLTNNNCNGGSNGLISLQATGGSGPYSYAWSNGPEQNNINNLPAGNYSVTITDDNECVFSESFTITSPPAINVNMQTIPVSCYNESNGTIDLSISGGTGAYSFEWNTGADTEDLVGLSQGVYTVTVTDELFCQVIETISIAQPDILQSNITVNPVSCNGTLSGSISLEVTGGISPYTYFWNNGYDGPNPDDLGAGDYSVTIVDANNCVETQLITISEPSILDASYGVTNNLCNGGNNGSINTITSGGTLPYSYLWSTGDTTSDISQLAEDDYVVTITDGNGCVFTESFSITAPPAISVNWETIDVQCFGGATGSIDLSITGGVADYNVAWSNGLNTEDVANLMEGEYSATITDANNCITSLSNIIITQVDSMTTTAIDIVPLPCAGLFPGSITVSTTGGTADYSYLWNTGDNTSMISTPSGGSYFVTVTDLNQCTSVASFEAPLGEGLTIDHDLSDVTCFDEGDGYISINVTGGTNQYEYDWSTGDTGVNTIDLIPGEYYVTVLDSEGCIASDTFSISEPDELIAVVTTLDPVAGMDGSISVTPQGGTAPYSIEWSTGAAEFDLSNLDSGSYSYTITDDNGCITEGTVDLAIIDGLTSIADIDVTIYPNPNNGLIHIESNLIEMEVDLIDLLGRKLNRFTKTQNQQVWALYLGDLESGVYYLHVRTPEGEIVKRIVIEQ